MDERFPLNWQLVAKARQTLGQMPSLYCVLGGSCTGKSTVSRTLSQETGIEALDMDGLIYGAFMASYTTERHPSASRWFGAENPLDWALSLTWDEFDALNRAADAEYLDLLAAELNGRQQAEPLLIDGGFTHPLVLSQVIPAGRLVCLAAGDDIRFETWETSPERATMKRWVLELEDGPAKWRKFLSFDKNIAETIVAESQAAGIPVIRRQHNTTIAETTAGVLSALGFPVTQLSLTSKGLSAEC